MLRFLRTWPGAAVFSAIVFALSVVVVRSVAERATSGLAGLSVAERTNFFDVLTSMPVVILVVYWTWFMTQRTRSKTTTRG